MLASSLLDDVQCMILIIKFMGGKFCDLEVNHENNENWHPTKITHYTVLLPYIRINPPWVGNLRMQLKKGVGAKCVVRCKRHVVSSHHPEKPGIFDKSHFLLY